MRSKILFFTAACSILLLAAPFLGAEALNLSEAIDHRIFFELRIPRILFLCFAGGSLAMMGGTYQTLFHNPLAEPYILGVSSAVTLALVIAEVILNFAAFSPPWIAAGIVGAAAATVLLVGLFLSTRGGESERLVLFGMGLNFLLSSAVFLLLSYRYQQMGGGSMRWIFGQIPWLSAKEVAWFIFLSVPLIVGEIIFSRHLDAIALGDGVAKTLGFSPGAARVGLLALTSAHIALTVAFCGAIGFVGLVVPHVVRLLFHPPTARVLAGLSFLLGAVFLSFSDIASRMLLPPFEFPIGIITTIIGGPIFLILLWKKPT